MERPSAGFIAKYRRQLSFGIVLAATSSVGQTYFLALFAPQLKQRFDLDNAAFGAAFGAASVVAAGVLAMAGRIADVMRPHLLAASVCSVLALSCAAMALAESRATGFAALVGLRLFGQAFMIHVAITALSRWFPAARGTAISICALGFPAAQAVLPALVVVSLSELGFSGTWLGCAVGAALAVPLVWTLGRAPAVAPGAASAGDGAATTAQWTVRQMFTDVRFYLLLLAALVQHFLATAYLFHLVAIAGTKEWPLSALAPAQTAFAISQLLALIAGGLLVDRLSARRLVPLHLLPLAAGSLVLAFGDGVAAFMVFMVGVGATAGGAVVVFGALWAELYGTRHIGTIWGVVGAASTLTTAVSPAIYGRMLDVATPVVWLGGIGALAVLAASAGALHAVLRSKRSAPPSAPG